MMHVDPKAAPILEAGKKNPTPVYTLPVEEARKVMFQTLTNGRILEDVKEVEDRIVPSIHHDIPIRIYTPEEITANAAMIYFHGGGFSLNCIETHDEICRILANRLHRVIISVEYRLAPENKYPAPIEDCIEAAQWIFDNSAALGIDSKHIAVGGDSGGATNSAVICQYFRDRNGVKFEKQVLIYPATDYYFPGTASLVENDPYSVVDRNFDIWAWNNYVNQPINLDDPYLCPLRAQNFKGLPEAIVITADCDPLRDEGKMYADKMIAAGVKVKYINYEGMMHGFFMKPRYFDQAEDAIKQIVEFLAL